VLGVWDDEVLGETIHGVVQPDREGFLAGESFETSVRRAVQDRSRTLPTYQRLQRIHIFEQDLPRNELGAIDRPRVRALLLQRLSTAKRGGVLRTGENEREPPLPPARNGSTNGAHPHHSLEEGMRKLVSRLAGVPQAQLASGSQLEADLRLDSLSRVEMLLA